MMSREEAGTSPNVDAKVAGEPASTTGGAASADASGGGVALAVEAEGAASRPKRGRFRPIRRLLTLAAILYVAWCTLLFFYEDKLVFPADMAAAAPPVAPRGSQVIAIEAAGAGRVEGLFWPTPVASAQNPAPVVVFCHGNAEIVDFQDFIVEGYRKLGLSVFLPEYRGYGRSGGKPGERAIVSDVVELHDLMLQRADVDRARIVLHGRSLGGGVAAQLAARRPPAALVLESTFTNVAVFALDYWAPPQLSTSPFHTDRLAGQFHFPTLVFHGTRDTVIPIAHGRRLNELISGSKFVEYPAGHMDFPPDQKVEAYWGEIETLLRGARVIR